MLLYLNEETAPIKMFMKYFILNSGTVNIFSQIWFAGSL